MYNKNKDFRDVACPIISDCSVQGGRVSLCEVWYVHFSRCISCNSAFESAKRSLNNNNNNNEELCAVMHVHILNVRLHPSSIWYYPFPNQTR
jgi:hypothetical protein